jgi:D-psicose/D-tagatose/L-ribulose 3-epimerase
VNTFVWYSPLTDTHIAEIVPRLAEWGFEGVEFPLESPGDWDPGFARELLERHGLRSVVGAVFGPERQLTAASEDVIAETSQYVTHCIDVAAIQGAGAVIGPMYTAVGRTWRMDLGERRSAIRRLRESLLPLAAYAADRSIRLGLEPLNRYETSLINTVEQALEVIDGIAPGVLGLNLDTYHQNIEEKSVVDAVRAAGGQLVHLHVCANDRGAPGDDHIPWDEIRAALIEIEFSGMMGIESFTADNASIATAASIWRPFARSQDELAQRGLAFLRTWRDQFPAE